MAISRLQQARQMRKGGGIMGSNAGSMLVAPTADGSRPGYYGPDEAHMSDPGVSTSKETAASFNRGEGSGISDRDAERVLAKQTKLREGFDNAARLKEKARLDAIKEQERIQKQLDKYRGVTPAAYSYGTKIDPYDFSKRQPGVLSFGIVPTAINLAKKYQSYKRNKELRELYGLAPVEDIEMDMPNAPFGRSRVIEKPIGGENNPYIIPQYITMSGTAPIEEDVEEEKTFEYRMGDPNTNQALDVTLGRYFNQGGRVPKNMGGIMNAVPRQGYFLGKIVKGVGKAIGSVADAAGKVLKSDLGKAALAAGAFYYGGGGKNIFNTGDGFFSGLGKMGSHFMSKSNPLLFTGGKLSLGKLALASGALPFLMPGAKPNEDIGMTERGGRLLDSQGNEVLPAGIRAEINEAYESKDPERIKAIENYYAFLPPINQYLPYPNYAVGGRVAAQEGGLMNLGGMEKDYRNEGGFVPIGKEEKADDVPARLSVNEFVFTADAVRNAGGGDIDKGAEVMENMMKNLENGGRVSEESQGNTGAQEMFSVSERIGEVI